MCAQYTPSYYHALIKGAGFETEKGAGEYTIEVSEDLVFRCRDFLKSVQESGYDIRPLKDIPAGERTSVFTTTWNQAFSQHWGLCTMTESEFESIFEHSKATQVLDLSAIAYRDGEPVGTVLIQREPAVPRAANAFCTLRIKKRLRPRNTFAVGVIPGERGKGVSLALASHAFLQLISLGFQHLHYGLVLDDNWPSRRVAEKLGFRVCANFVTYRRHI